jgi:hypothetical protein
MLALSGCAHQAPPSDETLFPLLTNEASKRFVVIGKDTNVLSSEKNRMQLVREVQLCFKEGRR